MASEFESDLSSIRHTLDESRDELLSVLRSLRDSDLEAQRRGGWPVRRILEHLVQSEHIYSRLIANLRGAVPSREPLPAAPSTVEAALRDEDAARRALAEAFDGVDEATFYTIGKVGHEEYSVLSVLENEVSHEREHASQITSIVAPA